MGIHGIKGVEISLLATCQYGQECWYVHEEKMETDEINVDDVTLKCNKCKQSFTEKNDLMEHRKTQHPEMKKM